MLPANEIRARAHLLAPLLLPVAVHEAFEARRIFRARGMDPGSHIAARRAMLSRLHLLPADLSLHGALVVDVGANEGDFCDAVLSLAPTAHVLALEPNPAPRARLEARLGGRVEVSASAVGLESGTARFNITAHDANSSFREPRRDHVGADDGWDVIERVDVEVVTLDDLVGERDVAVVKIDVQGAEMDVLRGGEQALARTRAVLMEVTFLSHYEADATFGGLHEEMVRQGFELIGISDPVRTAPDGIATWTDACYARPA